MPTRERILHGAGRAGIGVENQRAAVRATRYIDSALLMASLFGAIYALLATAPGAVSVESFLTVRVKLVNLLILGGLFVVWRSVCRGFSLYSNRPPSTSFSFSAAPKRVRPRRSLLASIAGANAVNTALLGLGGLLFEISIVTPALLGLFWALSTTSMFAFRELLAPVLPRFKTPSAVARSVLIVGTNERARRFGRRLEQQPGGAVHLIGFCDDSWAGLEAFEHERGSCVTDFKKFTDFLRTNVVDEVVIALPVDVLRENDSSILPACETLGVTVHFLSNALSDYPIDGRSDPRLAASGEPHDEVFVTVHNGLVEGSALAIKRALDVTFSLALLILVSPILAVCAIALRLESPGPIIFKQVRIGLNKRPFDMFKLRSMYEDAELRQASLESQNEMDGAAFKIENDPRITRVGNFLRRTSLDELPQLVNVVRGEMSLIGPRPLPLRDFARFDLDAHRRRFSVYPGITGLWQVSGRSSLSFEDWMQLDLHYVDNWSLLLDLKILIKTIPAVLMSVGAR